MEGIQEFEKLVLWGREKRCHLTRVGYCQHGRRTFVIGVHDSSMEIVGTDTYNYDRQKAILRLTERCVNLSTEGLDIDEFITDDTNKEVWVIHIPKHRPKLPVYAHNKA